MKLSNLLKITITASALSILTIGNAQAEQCSVITVFNDPARMTKRFEIWNPFKDAQFSQLETILKKRYEENIDFEGGDLLIWDDLNKIIRGNNMVRGKADVDKLVDIWVEQYPQSFFAQLSAGLLYNQKAGAARGSKFISETKLEQLEEMRRLDDKSIGYLQKAMKLNPHSALPQTVLLVIAAREGRAVSGKNTEQWLQAANQADPKNLVARTRAIQFLNPRWGGSFELLNQIIKQAKESLSDQSVRYLEFCVMLEKASHEEVITKNKTESYRLYKQAKDICENSISAQDGIIRTYQPEEGN